MGSPNGAVAEEHQHRHPPHDMHAPPLPESALARVSKKVFCAKPSGQVYALEGGGRWKEEKLRRRREVEGGDGGCHGFKSEGTEDGESVDGRRCIVYRQFRV